MARKIVSYALYGTDPVYLCGAVRNVDLQRRIYPGWVARFYVSQEIPESLVEKLQRKGAEVVRKTRRYESDGRFWRFLPAGEPDIEAVIVRDADSRIGDREKAAVDAWLASGKSFHIMRDHPLHRALIPGGMWGCRGGALPDIESLIERWNRFQRKGTDQAFLAKVVYPRIVGDCLVHSDLVFVEGEQCCPFPTRRRGGDFVGSICPPNADRPAQEAVDRAVELFAKARPVLYPLPQHRSKLRGKLHRLRMNVRRRFARPG